MTGLRWTQDQLDAHTQRAGLAKVATKVAKYRNTPTPPCSVAGATIEGVKVAAVVRVTIPFPPTVNHSTRPTASGGRILTDAHKAFRRAVLRLFVRLKLFDGEQAASMLKWPHSGFHAHTAVGGPADDRGFVTRLARYSARNPVALERLAYDRAAKAVT